MEKEYAQALKAGLSALQIMTQGLRNNLSPLSQVKLDLLERFSPIIPPTIEVSLFLPTNVDH